MKVLIVFDTKHGNTQQCAELIAEGINSIEDNQTKVVNVKDFDLNAMACFPQWPSRQNDLASGWPS